MADEFPAELRTRAGSLAMALGGRSIERSLPVALLRELERTRGVRGRENGLGQPQSGSGWFRIKMSS